MKVLLVALNAKYIHSCLAVYSLKAYAQKELKNPDHDIMIGICEYTINQHSDEILQDICRKKPDLIAFSCYIWNVEYIAKLAEQLSVIMPKVPIWTGGPEVSFKAERFLEQNKGVTGVMPGEGEIVFCELVKAYEKEPLCLEDVCGIVWRNQEGTLIANEPCEPICLDELPFPYPDLSEAGQKICYYESSRGCPFHCSYCLSSVSHNVRYKSPDKVYRELQFFLDAKVPLVKFVDRTFNCDRARTLAIWRFLKEHDNQVTRFHFEITADLLNEEELTLLSEMRPGLIQLEIGVQSANPDTLNAIHRRQDLAHLSRVMEKMTKAENVHLHLDLIAGLPFEDLDSFARSFDMVYAMRPGQLQLGFLKLLFGCEMHDKQAEYGLQCSSYPPYEVLATKWLKPEDILKLKRIETVVETYYNSGQFVYTLRYLLHFFSRPWELFLQFSEWLEERKQLYGAKARLTKYELIRQFGHHLPETDKAALDEILVYDLYLRENCKTRPDWAPDEACLKELQKEFYKDERAGDRFLSEYQTVSAGQLRYETHLERFLSCVPETACTGLANEREWVVLFHYRKKDPVNGSAFVQEVTDWKTAE